jgi:putative ABC transport system ATP-binding protein
MLSCRRPVPPSPSSTPVPRLAVRHLTRVLSSGGHPLVVLDDVSLEIAAGESVAVLGPSGSGKSTLLALMAGLDRPSSGEVLYDGREIQGLSEDALAMWRRGNVGFVFQSFQLLQHLTARENVLLPLELRGDSGAGAAADELLDQVGLRERGHHYPSQLSGGEQQRIAVARAFAARPALLLADEPTGNLDSRTGSTVLEMLARLQRRSGTSLVLVTHDPATARLAERRVHLLDGRLVRDERTSEARSASDERSVPPAPPDAEREAIAEATAGRGRGAARAGGS